MLKKMVKKLIKKFNLYDIYYYFGWKKYLTIYTKYKEEKKIFLLMTPTYGNLGDQAIEVATEEYIRENFTNYRLICVDLEDTCKHLHAINTISTNLDIVLLQGGGNMGNLYMDIENIRRFCIKHINKSKIISMPTTATYTNDYKGKRDLMRSKKIYNGNKNLTLLAREKFTYDFMKTNYKEVSVKLIPDMVFYMNKLICRNDYSRRETLICMRREKESNLRREQAENIISGLLEKFPKAFIFDTTVSREVYASMRINEINSLINEFLRAKVVVTDRMHGMILAAITGTPCVVMKSLDNKILGSYEWIKNVNYIELVNEPTLDNILSAIKRVENVLIKDEIAFQNKYFEKLNKIITIQ